MTSQARLAGEAGLPTQRAPLSPSPRQVAQRTGGVGMGPPPRGTCPTCLPGRRAATGPPRPAPPGPPWSVRSERIPGAEQWVAERPGQDLARGGSRPRPPLAAPPPAHLSVDQWRRVLIEELHGAPSLAAQRSGAARPVRCYGRWTTCRAPHELQGGVWGCLPSRRNRDSLLTSLSLPFHARREARLSQAVTGHLGRGPNLLL